MPTTSQQCDPRSRRFDGPTGYTLVEILVATVLSLMLLGAVVRMFGDVGQGITDSRAMLEAADRLRLAATRLQQDLGGITVTMSPPRKPEANEGYFEYIEGPVGVATNAQPEARNTTVTPDVADSSAGDFDDILMFTTRSTGRPFVGKSAAGGTVQSDVAEVAWFLRGRTLHRRILLVSPSTAVAAATYANSDVSMRLDGGNRYANTLGDLTKRENRFAHKNNGNGFPFSVSGCWGQLGLPTLYECSAATWNLSPAFPTVTPKPTVDFWSNGTSIAADSLPWPDNALATGTRIADDVILTNVIGFDVKAFDTMLAVEELNAGGIVIQTYLPGHANYLANYGKVGDAVTPSYRLAPHGDYADLGFADVAMTVATTAAKSPGLGHWGTLLSQLNATAATQKRVYDTWSTSNDNAEGSDGFDNNADGIVDDDAEKQNAPPYPVPLRGIQVKIRVFEPDSRQIREVTVVQDFLTQ